MIATMCLVQQGQISAEQEASLRADMTKFSQRVFDAEPTINWIEVPEGGGFTAAQPSTSVLVSMQTNRALDQADRETLLRELGDIWMAGSGRSANEVVTVIRDPQ